MNTRAITTSKLAVAIGIAALLALTTGTPSLGNDYFGNTGGASTRRPLDSSSAYRARAQARPRNGNGTRSYGRNVRTDDPPGSLFQTCGALDDQGYACR